MKSKVIVLILLGLVTVVSACQEQTPDATTSPTDTPAGTTVSPATEATPEATTSPSP